MRLTEWMRLNGKTDRDLAEALRCSVGAVRKYRSGERTPDVQRLVEIERLTDKLVTLHDFLPLPAPSGEEAA